MNPNELRRSYLEYFEQHGHRVVSSSPVVPEGDPTLLFTNAGMNQFKDVLLGNEVRDYTRAASVQKCIRAGGKHNDLDEVGKDGRHLTFFEMLGNWSFGDYYKRDSIVWAWSFLLDHLELDKSRLYVTVYKDDDESRDIWIDDVGLAPERVLRLGDIDTGDEENFWSMGPTGPCGPCTEIHYDLHPERGPLRFDVGYDEDRVVEIWNLVFMEFNRDDSGALDPLPMKSVDTGMGLDRVAMVLAGADNVFHTGLFRPIIERVCGLLGKQVDDWAAFFADADFSNYAVIADHVRTVTFALADGAKFANEGRGSVLRSILRRAVRHGRNLGFDGPFLHDVAHAVIESFSPVYPELATMGDRASELIRLEEERFFRTIDRGMEIFEDAAAQLAARGEDTIPGKVVFDLHATYGFPPDLTRVMAEEKNLTLDLKGYAEHWALHQETSRGKDVYADAAGVGAWVTVREGANSAFVGYGSDRATSRIMRYRELGDAKFELVLDSTPFYAESGGQIADTGSLVAEDGSISLRVVDVQKAGIGLVHTAVLERGELAGSALEAPMVAKIDHSRRRLVEANHTATHLLHEALREVVSKNIFQSGSLVAPDRLRFDFSHGQPLTPEQVRLVEDRVNRFIREGHPVAIHDEVPRDEAINVHGAMAIFGEKYGDSVRVVKVADTPSVELCGGCHVSNTRDIGPFRITQETGVAAGIRRIEAITNEGAYTAIQKDRDTLAELAAMLKSEPRLVVERVRALADERSELERRVDQLSQKLAAADSGKIVDEAQDVDGITVISRRIEAETRDQMLKYADSLRERLDEGVVLLAAAIDEKPALLCLVTESAFKNRKLKAGDLINRAASFVDGRGGGRPTLAQAGGTKLEGLSASVDNFANIVREALQ